MINTKTNKMKEVTQVKPQSSLSKEEQEARNLLIEQKASF